jgi:hypothetical protein
MRGRKTVSGEADAVDFVIVKLRGICDTLLIESLLVCYPGFRSTTKHAGWEYSCFTNRASHARMGADTRKPPVRHHPKYQLQQPFQIGIQGNGRQISTETSDLPALSTIHAQPGPRCYACRCLDKLANLPPMFRRCWETIFRGSNGRTVSTEQSTRLKIRDCKVINN